MTPADDHYQPRHRAWPQKLGDALGGIRDGVRGQGSFVVHGLMAAAVIACAVVFQVSRVEWCLLTISVFGVLAAEMFNSAIERIAKAIDSKHNQHLAAGLNTASGAVLLAAVGAACVGLTVFVYRLGLWTGWWT